MADIDELKAAAAQVVEAINTRNLEAFAANLHNEVSFFVPNSPFSLDGKGWVLENSCKLFANSEVLRVTLLNPQCQIVGHTGIVWGHMTTITKPKDGPLTNNFLRFTWSFARVEGKWFRVATHLSQIPSGN
jgi:ketosteroid isomerase-like protein